MSILNLIRKKSQKQDAIFAEVLRKYNKGTYSGSSANPQPVQICEDSVISDELKSLTKSRNSYGSIKMPSSAEVLQGIPSGLLSGRNKPQKKLPIIDSEDISLKTKSLIEPKSSLSVLVNDEITGRLKGSKTNNDAVYVVNYDYYLNNAVKKPVPDPAPVAPLVIDPNELRSRLMAPAQTNALEITRIPGDYYVVVTEEDKNPFKLNYSMVKLVNEKFKPISDEYEKSKSIFDWMENEIDYSKLPYGYRDSLDVMNGKQGICGEMTYLYVVLARCAGLQANYVSVKRDDSGKKVSHGCAGVYVTKDSYKNLNLEDKSNWSLWADSCIKGIGKRLILADVAYHTFDIDHREFTIISDEEAIENYRSWRGD